MPSCLGYFTEVIPVERRGRTAGASLLLSFLCAIVIDALVRMLGFQILGFLFMYSSFGILRLLGFIPLLSLGLEKVSTHRQGDGEHFGLSKVFDRRLGLYLVPWFIFNVIDTVEGLLLKDVVKGIFPDYYSLMQFVLLFSLSAFVLVGGILSDFIGRKPMVIVGLSTMGMAYALISIIPNNLAVWFFYFVSDGLAWGLFYTIFIAVIWGDLAPRGLEQLYYYVGSIPFFLASIAQITLASSVKLLNSTSAFSLAAIFLFLAVLPILFASETLPEKKIQERQVRDYVEKAKKLKEKHV
jgi:MFS family permease